jgi:hypothetical protein
MPQFLQFWNLSFVFQLLMLIHFFRTRPEFYWFFIILFLGPLGAAVYFFVEVLPGIQWKLPAIQRFERKRRREWLEKIIQDSPSQAAMAELAGIYSVEGLDPQAIELFSRAIQLDPEDPASLFGRGACYQRLGEHAKAVADFKRVLEIEPSHRFHSGYLALADAYDAMGNEEKAIETYEAVLGRTTLSGAYYGYGRLLARRGETERARKMMEEILTKRTTLPRYLRRQERPWFRKAKELLKTLPPA